MWPKGLFYGPWGIINYPKIDIVKVILPFLTNFEGFFGISAIPVMALLNIYNDFRLG